MKKFTVETKVIDFSDKSDPLVNKVYRETWPIRRQIFKANRKGNTMHPSLSFAEWIEITRKNPPLVMVNGSFIHSFVTHHQKKFMNFRNFADNLAPQVKSIHYFSCNNKEENLHRFFGYLKRLPKFNVTNRIIPIERNTDSEKSVFVKAESIDMTIVAMDEAYDDENLSHVLVFARDPSLIPLFKKLNEINVRVALVRAPNMPTSRALLAEANFILDLNDVLESLNSYSDVRISSEESVTDSESEAA